MVNALQIIVAMPLINVSFPQNAYVLSSFPVSIANFQLVPVS